MWGAQNIRGHFTSYLKSQIALQEVAKWSCITVGFDCTNTVDLEGILSQKYSFKIMFNGYYGLTYVSWDLFPSDSKAHLNFDTYGRKTVFSALGYGPVQALRQQHDRIHLHYWTRPETIKVIGMVVRSKN